MATKDQKHCPRRTSRDISGRQTGGTANGIWWVKTRDAAKRPKCTVPTTKHYPIPNVDSAEGEKL